MNRLKVLLILLITTTTILTACGEQGNETMQGTAESFVQALIDGDEEKIDELNRNAGEPTKYVIQKHAPKFSGLKVSDFDFEIDEGKNEVKITNETNGKKIRYWLTIEKIGEEYFVTYF